MTVKIVTDSAADLPAELAAELGIEIVPIKVIFGRSTFRDGVDPGPDDFTRRVSESSGFPTTSQPSPHEFEQVFKALAGNPILCITLSSELSGTYFSAAIAARQGGGKVEVVDSQLVSAGQGLLVLRAALLARQGHSLESLLSFVMEEKQQMQTYAVLDSIEPIVRGGRLNLFARHAADREGIKLIFSFNNSGRIQIFERVRGRRSSLDRLAEIIARASVQEAAVVHVDCIGEAQRVAAMIREQCGAKITYFGEAGRTVATYAGRGAVIVAGCARAQL